MPSTPESDILLVHLEWNIARLGEVLRQEPTEYYRDAALQRFGFTCDMAYKCLETFFAADGVGDDRNEAFRQAAGRGLFGDGDDWRDVVAAHAEVNQKPGRLRADAVFARLPGFHRCFETLLANLRAAPKT